jgi:uncharacterized surface protein with fasciclin (FAS1) repeats
VYLTSTASPQWTRSDGSATEADLVSVRIAARATYPSRDGAHANTVFGLARALDFAAAQARSGDARLLDAIGTSARAWYAADADYPAGWEPGGADFLSPALTEAELMSVVLGGSGDRHRAVRARLRRCTCQRPRKPGHHRRRAGGHGRLAESRSVHVGYCRYEGWPGGHAQQQALTNILTYHVVQQRRTPAELDAGTLPTLQGSTITTAKAGDTYTRTSYAGRAACLAFATPSMGTAGAWRMVATEANCQSAAVAWFRGEPYGMAVLTVAEDGIVAITLFGDPTLAEPFTPKA